MSTLSQLAFYYVVRHIEKFPVSALSLLPTQVRRRIFGALPASELWLLEKTHGLARLAEELDMEAVWEERIQTHISRWKTPSDITPEIHASVGDNREKTSFRDRYLAYVIRLLLLNEADRETYMHEPYDELVETTTRAQQFDQHKSLCFHLSRNAPRLPSASARGDHHYAFSEVPELVTKDDYFHFLIFGVYLREGYNSLYCLPGMPCVFDNQGEYRIPAHLKKIVSARNIQGMVGFLVGRTDWGPRKVEVNFPQHEKVFGEALLKFALLDDKQVDVIVRSDIVDWSEFERKLLKALFAPRAREGAPLIGERIIVDTYNSKASLIHARLFSFSGNNKKHDSLLSQQHYYWHIQVGENVESLIVRGLRDPCDGGDGSHGDGGGGSHGDGGGGGSHGDGYSSLLPTLVKLRPTLKEVELSNCTLTQEHLHQIVSLFLHASSSSTGCLHTLTVREWSPLSPQPTTTTTRPDTSDHNGVSPAKPPANDTTHDDDDVSSPATSYEQTLCIPFLPEGPCSSSWLLSLPHLSLKSLELTVSDKTCEKHVPLIIELLNTTHDPQQHDLSRHMDKIIVAIEAKRPPEVEAKHTGLIVDLSMHPLVSEVSIVPLSTEFRESNRLFSLLSRPPRPP